MGIIKNAYFDTRGFKLLWEKEKGINVDDLKNEMREKQKLKNRVVAAVPDAAQYYEWVPINHRWQLQMHFLFSCIFRTGATILAFAIVYRIGFALGLPKRQNVRGCDWSIVVGRRQASVAY